MNEKTGLSNQLNLIRKDRFFMVRNYCFSVSAGGKSGFFM